MSDRDELAAVIVEAYGEDPSECPCEQDLEVADAILAAGYSKPRTIETVEELATVYAGAIIRDADGQMWGIDGATDQLFAIPDGIGEPYSHDDVMLPATVLYEPAP